MQEVDQEPEGKASKRGNGIGHVPLLPYFAKAKTPRKHAGCRCWSWAAGDDSSY